ncbi:MAG TPA: hypothetical protein VGQ76_17815 [Thermoanaerobaculia bacterium]|jgi:tetratricopeptide (TPR) repeat protein|nr:hypothetical protein [Thermoanaerobaculia bacterium]
MKRASLALLLLLATTVSAAPPEKWWDAYSRGITAVNARNYKAAAEALQKSLAEMPNEGTNVRAGKQLITYVPHFWLGIAKFNLGDTDGALREWKVSEDQGVVARTEYYSRMKDWVARAQTEKQRSAQTNASGAKKAADVAISNALQEQLEALSAGGDRSESYQSAQRKLVEARSLFQKAGTDVGAYKSAEQMANQAASLFGTAAVEGKKLKAARTATPPPVKKPFVVHVPPSTPAPSPAPVVPPKTETAEPTPIITEAEVRQRIAEQEERRRKIEEAKKPAPVPVVVPETPARVEVTATAMPQPPLDLRPAYRAFASGDFTVSERLLTRILSAQPAAAEAYLLRGCARYTRAILSRTPDPVLREATEDFRAALQRNADLRLDRDAFSPKLVAFFEQVRNAR